MKILYQCDGFLPGVIGGVEVLSAQYLERMCARGHEILVVTPRIGSEPVGRFEHHGIPVIKLDFLKALADKNPAGLHALSDEVHKIESDFKPDIIHLNDVQLCSFYFLWRSAEPAPPFLLSLHSPVKASGANSLQGRLLKQADTIVAVSHSLLDDAIAADPSIASRTLVIHNALAEPAIDPSPLPMQPPVLLCIGRIVPEKGFDLAVRAFAGIRHKYRGLRLVIAGNGNEMKRLQVLSGDCGLERDVSFRGWVAPDDVPDLINQATMVLMPSRWREPFGLVALQAAQMARPVIASRQGGLAEVVDDGFSGLLVPPDDAAALAGAIETLLERPYFARELGKNAKIRAHELFNLERLLQAYEAAYLAAREHKIGKRPDRG